MNAQDELVQLFLLPYLADHSKAELIRESGVPATTLDRILNQPCNPSLENVLSLLRTTANGIGDITNYLLKHHKEAGEIMANAMSYTPPEVMIKEAFAKAITDRMGFLIICLAAKEDGGTTRSEIERVIGISEMGVLETLIENKVLTETGGHIKCPQFLLMDFESMFACLKNALTTIERTHSRARKNYHLDFYTEGLSKEGTELVQQAYRELTMKLREIANKYQGKHATLMGAFMGHIGEHGKEEETTDEK